MSVLLQLVYWVIKVNQYFCKSVDLLGLVRHVCHTINKMYAGYTLYAINPAKKNKRKAVKGSVYTCTSTWRQPGLRRGCVEFCVIRTHPLTNMSFYSFHLLDLKIYKLV